MSEATAFLSRVARGFRNGQIEVTQRVGRFGAHALQVASAIGIAAGIVTGHLGLTEAMTGVLLADSLVKTLVGLDGRSRNRPAPQ